MIASDWVSSGGTAQGPRPLDPGRDLAQVADLIDVAFGAEIDEEGQRVLQEMRAMSRAGPLLWFLSRASYEFHEAFGGYVWVEEGRVVGNVTLNRLTPGGNRWQISNVAVATPYRHQGIARQLMELALRYVRSRGGGWAVLQVRVDNAAAISLYEDLSFEALGGETRMTWGGTSALCPEGLEGEGLPAGHTLRATRPDEWAAEYSLARESIRPLMQWERPVRPHQFRRSQLPGWWQSLSRWIGGRETQRLGVFDPEERLGARVQVQLDSWGRRAQLRVLVARHLQGLVEGPLLREGLGLLPRRGGLRAEARFPMELVQVRGALEQAGFEEKRTLVHMRLNLSGRLRGE